MPRHEYPLSAPTRLTLSGNVKEIAAEMGVSDKYLYGILAETQTDPFAKFAHLYRATRAAGERTCHWRRELDAIDERYGGDDAKISRKSLIDCLTEKIHSDASGTQKFVEAMQDGRIDDDEAGRLLDAIDHERSALDLLEAHLKRRRALRVAVANTGGVRTARRVS